MSSMLKYVMIARGLGPSVGVASAQSGQPGYHVVWQIKLGGDGRWDYITIDTAGHRLFIARQAASWWSSRRAANSSARYPGSMGRTAWRWTTRLATASRPRGE